MRLLQFMRVSKLRRTHRKKTNTLGSCFRLSFGAAFPAYFVLRFVALVTLVRAS